jgi:hypothetical protein
VIDENQLGFLAVEQNRNGTVASVLVCPSYSSNDDDREIFMIERVYR